MLKAIIMIGGYGRNEGSHLQAGDGSFQPYIDCDDLLVPGQVSRAMARQLVDSLLKIWQHSS